MTKFSNTSLLYFASDFEPRRYRLVELTKEIAELFNSDEAESRHVDNLQIKGHPQEEAVLCTDSSTYALKDVQISNTMLIARPVHSIPPHLSVSAFGGHLVDTDGDIDLDASDGSEYGMYEIQDSLNSYVEVILTLPRLDQLRDLLVVSAFRGPDDDDVIDGELYTKHQLMEIIQASNEEIEKGLKELSALEINGNCRMVDPSYMERILTLILNIIVSEDLELNGVPLNICVRELEEHDDVPSYMIKHVLESFSINVDENLQRYSLSKEKTAKFYGIQLLAAAHPKEWPVQTFMIAWKESVLDLVEVSLDVLRGTFLKESGPMGATYLKYFPKHILASMDAKSRFEYLFKTRPKWTLDELVPYIEDVASDKKKLDAILLKYARASGEKKNITYTSRLVAARK